MIEYATSTAPVAIHPVVHLQSDAKSTSAAETSVWFGDRKGLFGVIRSPMQTSEAPSKTGVIFLTAGMLPCGGPFRLHVDLASRIAARGLPSIRFDLSGIGESFAASDSLGSLDRAATQTSAAIDELTDTCGIKSAVLFGLCSGADDAMHAAMQDHRVRGVVTMDGFGYRTLGFYRRRWFRDLPQKLTSLGFWKRRWTQWQTRSKTLPKSLQGGDDIREFPSRDQTRDHLQTLINRNVRMHFVYTGGFRDLINGDRQFGEMFPEIASAAQISHAVFRHLDHTATLRADRDGLIDHLEQKLAWAAG